MFVWVLLYSHSSNLKKLVCCAFPISQSCVHLLCFSFSESVRHALAVVNEVFLSQSCEYNYFL